MRSIRNSAKAVIIRDGTLAAIQIRDGGEEWYILPGGGQEPGELLSQTVRREVAEELGLAVVCGELLFVIEGARGESFHRVDLVFHCDIIGEIPDPDLHSDTNQVGVAWIPLDKLNRLPLYPSRLRRQIMNFYQGKPHSVYLGNECAGDPEILD